MSMYASTVCLQLSSYFVVSPPFANVLVSWSANASSLCSVVVCFVTLLCSSVVVSVGYTDLFLGLVTLLNFRQASLCPSESSISLQYFVQLFFRVCRVYCLIVLSSLL